MATAQAGKRAKEIGVRKTFGANRSMIATQFMGESVLIVLMAFIFSVVVIYFLSPYYTALTGKEVDSGSWLQKGSILLALSLVTSLIAGSYPSVYLSSLKLKTVLKGYSGSKRGSDIVRKALVVFQFVIGILLIVGSLTISDQLSYIQSKSLGFSSSDRLIIPLQAEEAIDQLEKVRNEFERVPGVHQVAGTTYSPAQSVLSDNKYKLSRLDADSKGVSIRQNDVDFQLIETLGIELVAGRTFDADLASEVGSSIVLNEAAVRAFGETNRSIVNRLLYTNDNDSVLAYKVIGVVKDFHSESLHKPIQPYLFAMRPGRGVSSVVVELSTTDYLTVVTSLEDRWEDLFPTLPFEFHFLDEQLEAQYRSDKVLGQLIMLFTGIAMVLCLIGIFGLTSFTVEQSLKEISIRKVLGASVENIYFTLTAKFLLLILIASCISIPIGMIVMEKWLELFAYRISPDISTVLIPVGIIVFSSLIVISYKTFFVARVNPTVILRSD